MSKRDSEGKTLPPFSKNLQRLKKERGLSVRALAEMAGGVDPSVLQGWLNGASPQGIQGLEAADKLATALGMGFRELMLGKKESSRPQSIESLFDEENWFEDFCKVKIVRLKPKKDGGESE